MRGLNATPIGGPPIAIVPSLKRSQGETMITRSLSARRIRFAAALLAGTALVATALPPAVAQETHIEPGGISHPLPDFVGLVKRVRPAVVSITSKIVEDEGEG